VGSASLPSRDAGVASTSCEGASQLRARDRQREEFVKLPQFSKFIMQCRKFSHWSLPTERVEFHSFLSQAVKTAFVTDDGVASGLKPGVNEQP
jgi:hypothetical protein